MIKLKWNCRIIHILIMVRGEAEMKITLRQLIVFVALLSVGLTMTSLVTWGYQASKESFTEEALETNEAYAKKSLIRQINF